MSTRGEGRSANGRSSIYRDDRGTWHGYVTMGRLADGKTIRRHVQAKTRSEVTAKVEELERARTGRRPVDQRRLTTGDWLEEWLTIIERTRKPMTYDGYVSLIRVHAGPSSTCPSPRSQCATSTTSCIRSRGGHPPVPLDCTGFCGRA